MTNEEFDKRMDRLTERHEALAESVESLRASVHEQHEAAIEQGRNIDKLVAVVEALNTHRPESRKTPGGSRRHVTPLPLPGALLKKDLMNATAVIEALSPQPAPRQF